MFYTMKKLIIPFLAIAALLTLSACSTVDENGQTTHSKTVRPEDVPADHPDNGPFSADPHSVFN